jgi:hypothetical protein
MSPHDEWFKEQVQVGIDQIKRGEFIEEEEYGNPRGADAGVSRRIRWSTAAADGLEGI